MKPDDFNERLEIFYDQLEYTYMNVIADLNTTSKARHNEHLIALRAVLDELDQLYIELVPNGYFHLLPPENPQAAALARVGYSLGMLMRFLQLDLEIP